MFSTSEGGIVAVYVRVSEFVEDTIPAFTGCEKCAYPLDRKSPDVMESAESTCPGCNHGEYWGAYAERQWVPLRWWNPTATRVSDGGLEVRKGSSVVAFYPVGAWLSYRSD